MGSTPRSGTLLFDAGASGKGMSVASSHMRGIAMTRPIPPSTIRRSGARPLLAAMVTVAALATGLVASPAAAQTAPSGDGLRHVPHGTSGRYEIARDARGYQAGTLRPVAPPADTRTRGQIARSIAARAAAAVATGAAAKVIAR